MFIIYFLISAQSGTCFALAWSTYVRHFGEYVRIHFVPATVMRLPLTLGSRLSCPHTGRITFHLSQCVWGIPFVFVILISSVDDLHVSSRSSFDDLALLSRSF